MESSSSSELLETSVLRFRKKIGEHSPIRNLEEPPLNFHLKEGDLSDSSMSLTSINFEIINNDVTSKGRRVEQTSLSFGEGLQT